MLRMIRVTTLVAGLLLATAGLAQVPAGAPAGSNGMCKDGSYSSSATKKGACRGHKGVKTWYGASAAGSGSTAAAAAAPAPAPAAAPAPARMTAKARATPSSTAAPGGGPGQVWANKSSKVYHCSSDRWYGKTKNGAYMSEADAKAQGYRPDHGKACQ